MPGKQGKKDDEQATPGELAASPPKEEEEEGENFVVSIAAKLASAMQALGLKEVGGHIEP